MATIKGPWRCPHCETTLPFQTDVHDEEVTPQPGDISLCEKCGMPSKFATDLTLTKIDPQEFRFLNDKTRLELFAAMMFIQQRERARATQRSPT